MRLRSITTIAAILAVIVVFSLPILAQQDSRIWLPFITTGDKVEIAELVGKPVGITPAERPEGIPTDWIQHPDGPDGKPAWGPDTSNAPPTFLGSDNPPVVEPGGIIYMSGSETLGEEIDMGNGLKVKLPPDVWTKAYVEEVLCAFEEGVPPCLETPFRVLAREGTTDTIILLRDGSFVVETENPATLARVATTFFDVTAQTGKTPIMDVRLPFVGQELKEHALP